MARATVFDKLGGVAGGDLVGLGVLLLCGNNNTSSLGCGLHSNVLVVDQARVTVRVDTSQVFGFAGEDASESLLLDDVARVFAAGCESVSVNQNVPRKVRTG